MGNLVQNLTNIEVYMSIEPTSSQRISPRIAELVALHDHHISSNIPTTHTSKEPSPRPVSPALRIDFNSVVPSTQEEPPYPMLQRGLPALDLSNAKKLKERPLTPRKKGSRDDHIPTKWYQLSPRSSSSTSKCSTLQPTLSKSEHDQPQFKEGKSASHFNHNLKSHLRNRFSTHNLVIFSKELFETSIRQVIDHYLTIGRCNSPRSDEAIDQIFDQIKTQGHLTRNIIEKLKVVLTALQDYQKDHRSKTNWTGSLELKIKSLVDIGHDVEKFVHSLETFADKKTKKFFEQVMGQGFHEYLARLKLFTTASALEMLRKEYALIKVDFGDADLIPLQQLEVSGAETGMKMRDINDCFVRTLQSVNGLTINNHPIDLKSLFEDISEKKFFLVHFLSVYYSVIDPSRSLTVIEAEADNIIKGNTVDSLMLLWICSVAWKEIEGKINIVFSPLTSEFNFAANAEKSSMKVEIKQEGIQITRLIVYDCFRKTLLSEGSNCSTSTASKIAHIKFECTVMSGARKESQPSCSSRSSSSSHIECEPSRERLWNAVIRMPKVPIISPDISYISKWFLLKRLIGFANVGDAGKLKEIPVFQNQEEEKNYLLKLVQTLDRRATLPEANHISPFTIEYFVKNKCREAINEIDSSDANPDLTHIASNISHALRTDGLILRPFKSNLRMFRAKLLDYIWAQSHRSVALDNTLQVVDRLLQTSELVAFLKMIERDFDNEDLRRLVLNNMIGGWIQGSHGHDMPHLQQPHIRSVINLLAQINSGYEFLISPLVAMLNDERIIDREKMLGTPHKWDMSPSKSSVIFNQPFKNIPRTFMADYTPFLEELKVNKDYVSPDLPDELFALEGTSEGAALQESLKIRKQRVYYTRLLEAIYASFDPTITAEDISRQVEFFLPENGEYPDVSMEQVPCLKLLKLATVSTGFEHDRFFRWLFDLNHAPLKTSIKPRSSCHMTITDKNNFHVEHLKTIGIYRRGIPDKVDGTAKDETQCLAEITLSWKVSTYREDVFERVLGILQNVKIEYFPIISAEEKDQIDRALSNPNSDFRGYYEERVEVDEKTGVETRRVIPWEFLTSTPRVQSPLGLTPPTNRRRSGKIGALIKPKR